MLFFAKIINCLWVYNIVKDVIIFIFFQYYCNDIIIIIIIIIIINQINISSIFVLWVWEFMIFIVLFRTNNLLAGFCLNIIIYFNYFLP